MNAADELRLFGSPVFDPEEWDETKGVDGNRGALWLMLLNQIDYFAFGSGDYALDYLEGMEASPPIPPVDAEDLRTFADLVGFDLVLAVKAIRDEDSQFRSFPEGTDVVHARRLRMRNFRGTGTA